jgi:DNA-binding response OmpR family regulator
MPDSGEPRLALRLRLLRSAGFAVITASDVATAAPAANGKQFDVLMSDLGLPGAMGSFTVRSLI